MAFSGWDIGGAHLKVARADKDGNLLEVIQLPCALWRGINELEQAISVVFSQLANAQDQHAITMTGELVDAFSNREQGVQEIVDCVGKHISEQALIYANKAVWLTLIQAKQQWQQVASMNWQISAAYAAYAAKHHPHALFIDIGSTTCDVIPIAEHQITPTAIHDHPRQHSGELVYTGAIRTPLMAIAGNAPVNGEFVRLAAEWFASSGDIWRILNVIPEQEIEEASADGAPWAVTDCQRRLARMLGMDAEQATPDQWYKLAQWFAEKQIQSVLDGCHQVLSRHHNLDQQSPLIGAGVGRFIVKHCAQRLGRPYIDFAALCQHNKNAADHAPAAALALLACHDFT